MVKANSFGATADSTRVAGTKANRAVWGTTLTSMASAERANGLKADASAGSMKTPLPHYSEYEFKQLAKLLYHTLNLCFTAT